MLLLLPPPPLLLLLLLLVSREHLFRMELIELEKPYKAVIAAITVSVSSREFSSFSQGFTPKCAVAIVCNSSTAVGKDHTDQRPLLEYVSG